MVTLSKGKGQFITEWGTKVAPTWVESSHRVAQVGAALSGWAQEALYCTGLLLDLEIGITQGCASPLGCTLLPDCACTSWCMHSSGTLLLMGELPMHSSIGVLL